MTDNVAILAGYTQPCEVETNGYVIYGLIKPDADLDGMFKIWDTDCQEWLIVSGWNVNTIALAGIPETVPETTLDNAL